ncbi:MAG: hypothetical protein GY757_51370 [bacterium]|nr:hypothetical protein [bacterium]
MKRLYKKFKKALETAASGVGLKVKTDSLLMPEQAFSHSLFRPVIEVIKKMPSVIPLIKRETV